MSVLGTVLGLALLTAPSGPAIEVLTSPNEIYVGDPVRIELKVGMQGDIQPSFPQWGETWGDAEIREVGPVEEITDAIGGKTLSQRLVVAFFETGDIALPPPLITSGDGAADEADSNTLATTAPIVVTVSSLLPPGEEIPEPQPPAPPLPLQLGMPFLWTSALLTLVALIGLAMILRNRHSEAAKETHPVDPLTALGSALDELRSEPDLDAAFGALSMHLRRFFGRSLTFPAAESTTTEIRRGLLEKELPTPLVRRAETLLRRCDGVKFARQGAARHDVDHGIEEAVAIGSETVSALAPPPPEIEAEEAI